MVDKSSSQKNFNFKPTRVSNTKDRVYTNLQLNEGLKSSTVLPNASRDYENNSSSSYLLNGIMPRKYSHINKLAQGLFGVEGVNEHNSLSTQKDMDSLLNKKGLQNQFIAANFRALRQHSYNKNQIQLKTTNTKFTKRHNSKRLSENMSGGSEKSKNVDIKSQCSQ